MKKHVEMSFFFLAIVAIIVTASVTAALPGQDPASIVPAGAFNDTTGNTTPLLFLGNQNIAPVIFLDGTTPTGVAVDIVNALAKHLSEPVEIRAMNWSEAQALVARGDADALIQINPTEERKKIYDFSDPLLESHFSIFTRADRMGISGLSSLRDLRVGVESGGLPHRLLEKDPQVRVTIIPNFTEGFRQLNEGSLDAVVVDYRVGSYILAVNNIRNIRISGEPIESSFSSIAVKKGNTKLLNEINTALQIIKADGTYQNIIDNWQPTEAVFETQAQISERNYRIAILILLLLFLIAVLWSVTIKKELARRKTAEENLREQYSTLHGIIDSAHALIFSVDRHYRYTSFNKGHAATMKTIYGAEIEQGHSILEYMTVEEDRKTARHNLDRALAGEQLVEEAYSGEELRSRHYFLVSHSPIRTDKEIIGVAVLAQDMTGRKQAEEALRESEEKYHNLYRNSALGIFHSTFDGRFIDVNPALAKLLGYNSPEEVVTSITNISGQVYAEPPQYNAVATAVLDAGGMVSRENRYRRRDGTLWYGKLHLRIVPDQRGKPSHYEGFVEDITERKRMQEALEESEARMRSILHASPVMQFSIDNNHHVISWNKAIETYSGIRAEDIQGTDGQWQAFYTEKRPVLADILLDQTIHLLPEMYPEKFSRSRFVDEGYEATDFFPYMGVSGKWLHGTAVPIRDAKGEIIGAIETLEDITERKNAEDALRESEKFLNSVFENIPDMIFVKDARDLRFVRFNKAGEDLLGFSREELYGKNDYDFFPRDEAAFFTEKDREVLKNRQLVDIPEEKIQTRLKGGRILHTKKIPIMDESGKPGYLMGISEDITERRRMENALHLARSKINLLNIVTFQDIQSAAFSISAYQELLRTYITDEKAKEFLEKQWALNQKIVSSLDFAKNFQDMGIKPPQWQNIGQVFLLAISHLDFLHIARNLLVENLEVYADPLLEMVFFHLMQNVIRYGGHATEVTLRYEEKPDGLVLFVEDNGVGIPVEEKHLIFDREFGKNTGLGLFFVREALSITDMTIRETGEPGKGARFEILVPKDGYRLSVNPST